MTYYDRFETQQRQGNWSKDRRYFFRVTLKDTSRGTLIPLKTLVVATSKQQILRQLKYNYYIKRGYRIVHSIEQGKATTKPLNVHKLAG